MEAMQRAVTDLVILCCSFGMFFLMYHLYQAGNVTFDAMLLATIAMMGSFGPVTALSSLSNNLNQTLASGERVLSLLEEEPMVEESEGEADISFEGASVEDVTFAYDEEVILKDCNINMKQGKVIGICGKSGCGKSTLLKLLMRFWDVNKGNIKISEENVKEIPTKTLRNTQSYVTQETELFHDSIANNVTIGKPGAAREEIIKAAQKASIHDMIMSLPNGYDTEVGELGDTLSGGEKQRIGIARAFLNRSPSSRQLKKYKFFLPVEIYLLAVFMQLASKFHVFPLALKFQDFFASVYCCSNLYNLRSFLREYLYQ